LTWWNQLFSNTALTEERLRKLAGDFARRVQAYAHKHKIALRYCAQGKKTSTPKRQNFRPRRSALSEGCLPYSWPKHRGWFWQAKNNREGKVVVRRPKSWRWFITIIFHIVDPEWGHVTIRMSGHPPFGLQISLNGHEWVQRQARKTKPSPGSRRATVLWAVLTWPASMGWLKS